MVRLTKYHDSFPALVTVRDSERRYGSSFLLEAVQSFQNNEKAAGNPRDELQMYLDSGIEQTDDVIQWWGVHRH